MRKRYILVLSAALLLAALLCSRAPAFISGSRSQADGDYEAAALSFEAAGAKNRARGCAYALALEAEASGELYRAARIFSALGDYSESAAGLSRCADELGDRLLAQGDYAGAEELMSMAPQAPGLKKYAEAEKLLASGDYRAALGDFTRLSPYGDSAARAGQCREGLYSQAQQALAELKLAEAEELFRLCGDWEHSEAFIKYIARLNDFSAPEESIYSESILLDELQGGRLYAYRDFFFYVPDNCGPGTASAVYYAGGLGGPILRYNTVMDYLRDRSPDAVMLFYTGSGINDTAAMAEDSFYWLSLICREEGITVRELLIAGSSLGCVTAMKACPYYYEHFGLAARAVILLDMASEWKLSVEFPPEELKSFAETGALCCMYEQKNEIFCQTIQDIHDAGCPIAMLRCRHDDHDSITVYGFRLGCFDFGWSGEYDTEEYEIKYY